MQQLWNGIEHTKRWIWWFIIPLFLFIRWVLLKSRILKHEFRQPFLIGKLADGQTPQGLYDYLTAQGFTKNYLAWVDKGEAVGVRRLCNIHHQYHIRLFHDGEIRGHYEWTPEARPFDHLFERGFEERREEFLKILGDRIAPTTNQD